VRAKNSRPASSELVAGGNRGKGIRAPAPERDGKDAQEQRVAKLMAARGLCSRREAERLIEAGQVLVDGTVVSEQGVKVPPDAEIRIASAALSRLKRRLTVVLNKPARIVSTQPQPGQTPAWKLLGADNVAGPIEPEEMERVLAAPASFSVAGRLDRASRGLLVLTQDGIVARRLIGGFGLEKVYRVHMSEPVSEGQIRKLEKIRRLDDKPLQAMRVKRVSAQVVRFVLTEGRKHQIRRASRKVGLRVEDLFREAVGPFRIGELPEGCWRLATAGQLARLPRC